MGNLLFKMFMMILALLSVVLAKDAYAVGDATEAGWNDPYRKYYKALAGGHRIVEAYRYKVPAYSRVWGKYNAAKTRCVVTYYSNTYKRAYKKLYYAKFICTKL